MKPSHAFGKVLQICLSVFLKCPCDISWSANIVWKAPYYYHTTVAALSRRCRWCLLNTCGAVSRGGIVKDPWLPALYYCCHMWWTHSLFESINSICVPNVCLRSSFLFGFATGRNLWIVSSTWCFKMLWKRCWPPICQRRLLLESILRHLCSDS